MTYLILLALVVVAALAAAARLFPRTGATPRGTYLRRRSARPIGSGRTPRDEGPEEGASR